MKTIEMDCASLERFVTSFLPEGAINHPGKKNELRLIGKTLSILLQSVGRELALENLFQCFNNLSYTIAVIEPLEKGEQSAAYLATNTHSICIGIDAVSLKKLTVFAKVIANNELFRSRDSRFLARQLIAFA
jgi:hypothetical protein